MYHQYEQTPAKLREPAAPKVYKTVETQLKDIQDLVEAHLLKHLNFKLPNPTAFKKQLESGLKNFKPLENGVYPSALDHQARVTLVKDQLLEFFQKQGIPSKDPIFVEQLATSIVMMIASVDQSVQ